MYIVIPDVHNDSSLEREVERLRSRINRPASSVISDTASASGTSSVGSPRKLKPS